MKLLRKGQTGHEKPAMIDPDGRMRDLSGIIRDIDADALSPAGLLRLRSLNWRELPVMENDGRIGPCVPRPLNYVCIGLNYADHAAEAGMAVPKEPIIFLKSLSAYSGPYDDVRIPRGSQKTDWEVELGVVIGTRASHVSEADSMDYVAGYCVCNDISERSFQIERGGTWDKGKGCDTFGPTGPWLVTKDEVPDPQSLDMWLDVDGVRMQSGNTRTMVFNIRQLISYVSAFITLHPGDIVVTGTPPGVGMGKKPEPVFLRPGQTMRLGIAGLGEQSTKAVMWDQASDSGASQ